MPATAARTEYRQKRRITLIGAVTNLLLAIAKIVFGVIGQSQALVVDGVHSLSDLLSDALVLTAARFGSQAADADHPYGHGRIETAATAGIGLLLLAAAAGFAYDAAQRLLSPGELWIPGWLALAAALASILIKELLYRYTAHVGRRLGSPLIEANAWHHRSDALSSVVVVVGVLGAMAGYAWFDAVAAIVVAAMVGLMGWRFVWESLRELVDTGLARSELDELRAQIDTVPGVLAHHELRTRRMAGRVLVDVHVQVTPWLSVSEGHRIAVAVRAAILQRIARTADVLVHVDAEDGFLALAPKHRPPLRNRIDADLRAAWQGIPEAERISRTLLHYHGDAVHVELLLPATSIAPERLQELAQRLEDAAAHLVYLGRVRVTLG